MNKEFFEKIINKCLSFQIDYIEIYYEKAKATKYILNDSKIDDIITQNSQGVGIRLIKNDIVYYTSTNKLDSKEIMSLVNTLLKSINTSQIKVSKYVLPSLEEAYPKIIIPHNKYPLSKKVKILKEIDKISRNYSPLISQVKAGFNETEKEYIIATNTNKYIASKEVSTRLYTMPFATDGNKIENTFKSYGKGLGYELLDNFDYQKMALETAKVAVNKLNAIPFKGGKFPVILGNGFGAVIFHEACGHALEATSVADNISFFSNKLNEKIASSKVTLVDDGTIPGEWGTTIIDSEGNKTQKNILIANGILKSYLVDGTNSKKMHHPLTASSRRQNYQYPPTSRMNNTYLLAGTDKIEDMIKSIDYGVYCKSLQGGSVIPETGDFNFSADECYLIKNGEIKEPISGITLIGKGQEILKNVEMVSNDLKIETGYCGSISGLINVTIGEPTIKVSEILIGGQE